MNAGGRTAICILKIPSPAPNHKKNLSFIDHKKKEPPNSIDPKVMETLSTVVLTWALFSRAGGGGGQMLA